MSSTRVINLRTVSGDAYGSLSFIYIGRGSKWGNPFTHLWSLYSQNRGMTVVGSREEAIEKYEAWLRAQPDLMAQLSELRGRTLGCYCKPLACHGDVLVRLADA